MMNMSASGHLCNNVNLHFYGSYLAARLAGMSTSKAYTLALYCRSMVEFYPESSALQSWNYQGMEFAPCITSSGAVSSSAEPSGLAEQLNDPNHTELAFHRLPAFDYVRQNRVDHHKVAEIESEQSRHHGNELTTQNSAKHSYHPLTDIDWQGGGGFKPSFAQKLAKRFGFNRLTESEASIEPEPNEVNLVEDKHLLQCKANSRFARVMLNDTIYHSRYCDKLKNVDLALLGCRLFVYQNTWIAQLKQQSCDIGPAPSKDSILLDAFYWTVYAIECFVKGISMADKLRFNRCADSKFQSNLTVLLGFDGDVLEGEYLWLDRLPSLLSRFSLESPKYFDPWWQGFRYQSNTLQEQAMLQSGSGLCRQIKLLSNFRKSHFFKLNKAVEHHSNWLYEQLCERGLDHLNTAQRCSTYSEFQL